MRLSRLLTPACFSLLLVACDPKAPEPTARASASPPATGATPTGSPQPGPGATPGAPGAATEKQTSLAWKAPASFALAPSQSSMRLATYKISKAEGDTEDAELSVTQVGGDLPSNISRWSGQFEGSPMPKTSERTINGLKITIVEIEGTYSGMAMPGQDGSGPKTGYALLAAIAESQKGHLPHFFKMTGPKKTIDAARPAFDELVNSFGEK